MGNIFTIVPVDTRIGEADLVRVRNFLALSPGCFFTARQIAVAVGLPSSGTQVHVRKVIKLLQSRMVPIVSHDAGFSFATGPGMVRACLYRELRRRAGLDRSIAVLERLLDSMGCHLTIDEIPGVDGELDEELC